MFAALAAAKPAPAPRDVVLKPTSEQAQAALLATRFLTRFHYKAEPLDAAMSQKIFDRYFDSLDGDRLFFLQADVDRFAPDR
ncbi:MAG: carboxy terminal-processing peptidase, partial [Rudaea sp.]